MDESTNPIVTDDTTIVVPEEEVTSQAEAPAESAEPTEIPATDEEVAV